MPDIGDFGSTMIAWGTGTSAGNLVGYEDNYKVMQYEKCAIERRIRSRPLSPTCEK
jgi:hypothetical protein